MRTFTICMTIAALLLGSSLALADNSGLGETSSTQTRKKVTIRVDAKKGSLRMRTGQLEGRIATEKGTALGDKDGKRISFILNAPAMLINKDPGQIHARQNVLERRDMDFYQESSGVLLNPGAEIMARFSKDGFIEGPTRYIVDAQGLALLSYQVVVYRSDAIQEAYKLQQKRLTAMNELQEKHGHIDVYECRALVESRAAEIERQFSEDELKKLKAADSDKLKDKLLGNIDCYDLSYAYSRIRDAFLDVDLAGVEGLANYFRAKKDYVSAAVVDDYIFAVKQLKSMRQVQDSVPSDLKPYLTFDVRFLQAGGVFKENKAMGQLKQAGTISIAELSFEASVLFNDVLNVTFQVGGDPLRVETGKIRYLNDPVVDSFMGRTEGFAGIKFGGKYVQLSDKFSVGYDWARASTVKNEMSLELMKRGRIGWQVEHERSYNAAPVTTHMFFIDAIAF